MKLKEPTLKSLISRYKKLEKKLEDNENALVNLTLLVDRLRSSQRAYASTRTYFGDQPRN